jgi:hypothetical protein
MNMIAGRDENVSDRGKRFARHDGRTVGGSGEKSTVKEMITICAECKKVLKRTGGAAIVQAFAGLILNEEVIYSHGICYECGVKLYSAEIMAKAVPR